MPQLFDDFHKNKRGAAFGSPLWKYFGATGTPLWYRSQIVSDFGGGRNGILMTDTGWGNSFMGHLIPLNILDPSLDQWEVACEFRFPTDVSNKDLMVGIWDPVNNQGYFSHVGYPNVFIGARTSPWFEDGVNGTSSVAWTWAADQNYRMRFGFMGDRSARGKLWKAETDEPAWGKAPDSNGTQFVNTGYPNYHYMAGMAFFFGFYASGASGSFITNFGASLGKHPAPLSYRDVIDPFFDPMAAEVIPGSVVVGGGGGGGGGSGIPSTYAGPSVQRFFRPGISQ